MAAEEEISRDEFVRQMVAHLRMAGQAKRDGGRSEPSQEDQRMAAQKAFQELGFDFPQVEEGMIRALDALVQESLMGHMENDAVIVADWFWLSPKVLEGLHYCLFERPQHQGKRKSSLEHQQQPQSGGLNEALASLYATLVVKVFEHLLSKNVSLQERERLFLGRIESRTGGAIVFSKLCIRLIQHLERINYNALGGLTCERWESLHMTACLFRLVRFLRQTRSFQEILGPQDDPQEHEKLVHEAQAAWPRLTFILRDRITDKPESMESVLPALVELSAYFNDPLATSDPCNSIGSGVNQTNPVLVAMVASICCNKSIRTASKKHRFLFWDYIAKQLLPSAVTLFQELLDCDSATEQFGPRAEDQLANLMTVLEYYSRGNPQRVFGHRSASDALFKKGVIHGVLLAWIKGKPDAFPQLLPAPAVSNPDQPKTQSKEARVQQFLFLIALRSPQALLYFVQVDGFLQRAFCSLDSPLADRFVWAVLLSSSLSQPGRYTKSDDARFVAKPVSNVAAVPNSKLDLDSLASQYIQELSTPPYDRDRMKQLVDVVVGMDVDELVHEIHHWKLKPNLIQAFKDVMRGVKEQANEAARFHHRRQQESDATQEGTAHEESLTTVDSKVTDEALIIDRANRLHQLIKRFLCKLEDLGDKAD